MIIVLQIFLIFVNGTHQHPGAVRDSVADAKIPSLRAE